MSLPSKRVDRDHPLYILPPVPSYPPPTPLTTMLSHNNLHHQPSQLTIDVTAYDSKTSINLSSPKECTCPSGICDLDGPLNSVPPCEQFNDLFCTQMVCPPSWTQAHWAYEPHFTNPHYEIYWHSPPIHIDCHQLFSRQQETEIDGAQWRYELCSGVIARDRPLCTGNVIFLEGVRCSQFRYMVTWTRSMVGDHYLVQVNAMCADQSFAHFNDPEWPTLILKVPREEHVPHFHPHTLSLQIAQQSLRYRLHQHIRNAMMKLGMYCVAT
jgi:hypothetical protein